MDSGRESDGETRGGPHSLRIARCGWGPRREQCFTLSLFWKTTQRNSRSIVELSLIGLWAFSFLALTWARRRGEVAAGAIDGGALCKDF